MSSDGLGACGIFAIILCLAAIGSGGYYFFLMPPPPPPRIATYTNVGESGNAVTVEFRIGQDRPQDGWKAFTVEGSKQKLYFSGKAELTNAHIKYAAVEMPGNPQILIHFTEEGKAAFAKLTRENVRKHLGFFVDGKLIYAPTIMGEIPSGTAVITGNFSKQEADRIARAVTGNRAKK